jgi:Spy/CpxP family protein refolding chaperone
MKTQHATLLAATLLSLSFPLVAKAQEMTPPDAAATNDAAPPPRPGPRGPMANLSEEERSRLKAAHDQAIRQNPGLEAAMEKARKDMHDAMLAADPSIEPLLAKIAPPKHWGEGKGGAHRDGDKRHAPPGLANLTAQEREQLKTAHQAVKDDPSIVTAREAVKSATTPETRRAAHEALREASDAAMLKVDPTLQPILDKLHQKQQPSSPADAASGSS